MECTASPLSSAAGRRLRRSARGALIALLAALGAPAAALAHGPIDPAGSKFLARIAHVPAGLEAKVVDGDLRMWLRVRPRLSAYVLDYRGAPYLHFSPAGVWVNENSSMYYLNQVPPVTPSESLGRDTPPSWHRVSAGHAYEWHDGRLHALAVTARAPGTSFAGDWSIPLRVDGGSVAITGALYHAPDPSPVWFWPIVVSLGCVAAALRLRRSRLDARIARLLAGVALAAFAVASVGHQLHGRPGVSVGNVVALAFELALAAAAAWALARRRPRWPLLAVIAAAALWQGISLAPALTDGWVLLALPAAPARVAVAACLAAGAGLVPVIFAAASRTAGALPVRSADERQRLEPSA